MARLLGETVERADPEWVRARTGYPIGGVPPVGQPQGVVVLLDQCLAEFPEVFAAAGHPRTAFGANLNELSAASAGAVVMDVSE